MMGADLTIGKMAGRRILITGAGSGIGRAVANLFSCGGARIAHLDLRAEALAHVDNPLDIALTADVSVAVDVNRAVQAAAEALGGLDGIVNAAGIFYARTLAETTDEDWARVLGVHLNGPFHVCRAALPYLRQSGRATIVNFTSVGAIRPRATLGAYSTAKAGVATMTKILAAEEAPLIRANVISPGVIFTPMVETVMGGRAAASAVTEQRNAMKRLGEAEELARAVLYLSNEDSSFVTGSILSVDGGEAYY